MYEWKAPGRKGTLTKEIARDELFDALPIYVLETGNSAEFFSRETLGLVATASKDKILTKRSGPHEFFSWPLTISKEWRTSFVLENVAQKSSQKLAYLKVISAVEEVKVPAGIFEAFKIETYGAETGTLLMEQWYAPKARWFVKTRNYLQPGVREEELASLKIE